MDIRLDIQNVIQKPNMQYVTKTNTNFGTDLRKLVVEQTQETMPDGKIKITMVLDPSIKEL